jgi:hypothetical protein
LFDIRYSSFPLSSGNSKLDAYGVWRTSDMRPFFSVGAYTVRIPAHQGITEALLSWSAAICAASLISHPIGAVSLRTAGAYFIMITLPKYGNNAEVQCE